MDQTGLSQKAGPVISDLLISERQFVDSASRAAGESVDLLLGFDLMVAGAAAIQESLRPGHTTAVISTTRTPTGAMVSDVKIPFPDTETFARKLEATLGRDKVYWADATELTQRLFADSSSGNVFLIGMALQTGALPVSARSLEDAITMNGVAVESNIAAFRAGRWWVVDPRRSEFDAIESPAPVKVPTTAPWFAGASWPSPVRALAEHRAADLVEYQDRRYAKRYVDVVRAVAAAEESVAGEAGSLTMAVARNLYKLMAYKDEYEVARLSFDPVERARVSAAYGPGARVYWNLHPPVLRNLGMKSKLRLGAWFTPAFIALRRMRRLRGTPFDIFGRTEVRRLERALVAEYTAAITVALSHLDRQKLGTVIELAELPAEVRGYEQLKLDSGSRFLVALDKSVRALS
jgi:indolepyruvate ferredoxin oxidoreductase